MAGNQKKNKGRGPGLCTETRSNFRVYGCVVFAGHLFLVSLKDTKRRTTVLQVAQASVKNQRAGHPRQILLELSLNLTYPGFSTTPYKWLVLLDSQEPIPFENTTAMLKTPSSPIALIIDGSAVSAPGFSCARAVRTHPCHGDMRRLDPTGPNLRAPDVLRGWF